MAEDVRDQLKAAKQLVVENNKALKALKEGTREYKRQEKILNKAKESVTSISTENKLVLIGSGWSHWTSKNTKNKVKKASRIPIWVILLAENK